jgi:hypothetical protein
MVLASPTRAVTILELRENDPGNLSALNMRVDISDGISTVVAFDESIPLNDMGSGTLEYELVGILGLSAEILRFDIAFGGPFVFDTVIGAANIPVTLTLEEARYSVFGTLVDELVQLGDNKPINPNTHQFDAQLRGSISIDGTPLPFDLRYSQCAASDCSDGGRVYFDDFDSIELSGGPGGPNRGDPSYLFRLRGPSPSDREIGQVNGLSVELRPEAIIRRATFVAEQVSEPAGLGLADSLRVWRLRLLHAVGSSPDSPLRCRPNRELSIGKPFHNRGNAVPLAVRRPRR